MLQIKHYEMLETFNSEKSNLETPWVAYVEENSTVYYSVDDITKYRIFCIRQKDISNITYEAVDLGLPSGTLWADRNVGASSPEDYGSYFQWGDTNAYTYDGAGEVTAAELAEILNPTLSLMLGEEITADNVGEILERMGMTDTDLTPMGIGGVLGKFFNWDSYFDTTDNGSTFIKYNNNGGLTVLESSDDAAAFHMGTQYRMPTSAEIQELISGTTQTFIDLDGKEYIKGTDTINIESGKLKGVRFTSSNGNSIFIPAAGNCYESLLNEVGMNCKLWSSSLSGGDDNSAGYLILFYSGNIVKSGSSRCYGQAVRGVLK